MRWLLAIALCGCAARSAGVATGGNSGGTAAAGVAGHDPPAPAGAPHVAPASPAADVAISLPGAANALWWDAASSTLYLTDSAASALVTWTDAGGLRVAGRLPAVAAGVSLGGIVRRADGTLVIANFGFGTEGGLLAVAGGAATALTGLDPARRRVGLAQDAAGTIYSAYFVGGRGKPPAGGVAVVAIDGTTAQETEVATGFHKAVGLVATPAALFVSDQTDKAIWKIAVPGFAVSRLASVPAADLLAVLPGGDLVTGGGPAISRITPAGEVSTLRAGFEQVRGLAVDAAGKRLFVIDHSVTVGVPDKLRILPLAN